MDTCIFLKRDLSAGLCCVQCELDSLFFYFLEFNMPYKFHECLVNIFKKISFLFYRV